MKHKTYAWSLLAATLIFSLAFKFVFTNSARCDAFGGGPKTFMAYCDVSTHGHYDHAAYLFNLEGGLTDHIRQANLLFLGSSRTQFAFSTSALTDFVARRPAIHPYLLGFGHVEQDVFAAEILDRMKPTPSVIVINADPFFARVISPHAQQLLENETLEKTTAKVKQLWHPMSEAACKGNIPVIGRFICGDHVTMYRSVEDGRWISHGEHLPTIPVSELEPSQRDDALLEIYVSNAKKFINKFSVDRKCIVLTFVPTVNGKPSISQKIAARLGTTFIAPRVDELFTYDGSHLDTKSSERWSQSFLAELEPVLASCLP